jgi:hypothetical protein
LAKEMRLVLGLVKLKELAKEKVQAALHRHHHRHHL